MYGVAILTISDRVSKKQREDKTGELIKEMVQHDVWELKAYDIVCDDLKTIKEKLIFYADEMAIDLVLTNGGTGFSSRDVTPEATKAVIEREVQGIPEVMRREGYKITPKAMFSRGVSGIRGKTLIINLPGSPRGAIESLEAVLDELPHGLDMIAGKDHE